MNSKMDSFIKETDKEIEQIIQSRKLMSSKIAEAKEREKELHDKILSIEDLIGDTRAYDRMVKELTEKHEFVKRMETTASEFDDECDAKSEKIYKAVRDKQIEITDDYLKKLNGLLEQMVELCDSCQGELDKGENELRKWNTNVGRIKKFEALADRPDTRMSYIKVKINTIIRTYYE